MPMRYAVVILVTFELVVIGLRGSSIFGAQLMPNTLQMRNYVLLDAINILYNSAHYIILDLSVACPLRPDAAAASRDLYSVTPTHAPVDSSIPAVGLYPHARTPNPPNPIVGGASLSLMQSNVLTTLRDADNDERRRSIRPILALQRGAESSQLFSLPGNKIRSRACSTQQYELSGFLGMGVGLRSAYVGQLDQQDPT